MGKFRYTAIAAGVAMIAFAGSASAVDIKNASDCQVEGGTMVNVKNSDYCLVPIRDEAYADPIYDGNQLGVVECPGNKLNDGKYCMYPVTIRPNTSSASATPSTSSTATMSPAPTTASMTDTVKGSAEKLAKDTVKRMK